MSYKPHDASPEEKDPWVLARRYRIKRMYEKADEVIEEAISPENMRNNPYKGKPLNLTSNPYDRGYGMAYRMLKNSGHKLPWMEERDEIVSEKAALEQLIEEHSDWLARKTEGLVNQSVDPKAAQEIRKGHQRFLRHLEDRVGQLRKKIERFNLEVPILDQQMVNVRTETYVARASQAARKSLDRLDPKEH